MSDIGPTVNMFVVRL